MNPTTGTGSNWIVLFWEKISIIFQEKKNLFNLQCLQLDLSLLKIE